MNSPWDEFSAEDRKQLLQIAKEILTNQLDTVEGQLNTVQGAYGLWDIVLNYNFSNSEVLSFLQGVVDECASAERGEAHLYSPEFLKWKDERQKEALEWHSPQIKEIASKIIDELAPS